jgi:hypothetical protein
MEDFQEYLNLLFLLEGKYCHRHPFDIFLGISVKKISTVIKYFM